MARAAAALALVAGAAAGGRARVARVREGAKSEEMPERRAGRPNK